jgi:hypothetical protein
VIPFRSQGFRVPFDPESQMAVSFADAERKDLLQIEEATGDVFPLFVINRFDVSPVILRLLDNSVRIVKNDFACRGPGQDLSPTVRKGRETFP